MKFDQEVLAGNIRGLRHKARMSQQEVADALGVDANTVSNYESGRTVPSFEKAWMIASLFGVSLDALGGRNAVVEQMGGFAESLLADRAVHGEAG